jgi:DNA polymerase-4
MDCDAFYASVEKRDNPELASKPVIIGGGRRGVVSTACYVARVRGVKSAMPMFQALKLCPEAVVVRPRMEEYVKASAAIRKMMQKLTPAIEPLSLDEAFLDMTGTTALHGAPPAVMLARLVKRMKEELGLTGSIGLSHNKFLAKVASDLDKPRGFSVIGKAETHQFLKDKPIRPDLGRGIRSTGCLRKSRYPHICGSIALGTARPDRTLRIHGGTIVAPGPRRRPAARLGPCACEKHLK